MDALTTTDADATTLSGLSYFCAAAVDAEMAMALSWVEMAAVKQSGSSCFCAAVADAAETTTETAVAASKSKSNLTTHLGTTKTGGYDASGSFCLLLYMKSILANTVSFYFSFVLFICLLTPGGCFRFFLCHSISFCRSRSSFFRRQSSSIS